MLYFFASSHYGNTPGCMDYIKSADMHCDGSNVAITLPAICIVMKQSTVLPGGPFMIYELKAGTQSYYNPYCVPFGDGSAYYWYSDYYFKPSIHPYHSLVSTNYKL